MIPLPLAPKIIKKNKNQSIFEIEGLYSGYGVTIGNALRRVLLSSLSGAAVTQVKIKGVSHEFSTIPGVLEDVTLILLNLKKLRFRIFETDSQIVQLKVKGEREVRGSDFKLPSQVKLANPDCYIASLTSKSAELDMEIQIEKGIGYEPVEMRKSKNREVGVIALDAIFTPIKKVSYRVENMRVGERTDFDRLNIEIETDGTITPEEAFFQAVEILIKHFSLLKDISNKEKSVVLKDSVGEKSLPKKKINKKTAKKVKKASKKKK